MIQKEGHLSVMHRLWLAADYHFPATYSCRLPMSSMTSATITPAPGPATVRLALVKVGIECFGYDEVRQRLFPIIRSMSIRIRPPEKVALSPHILHAYKTEERQGRVQVREAPIIREMAHAEGPMTVYLQVPGDQEAQWVQLLDTIGYWGQTDSFTTCLHVDRATPNDDECACSLQDMLPTRPAHSYLPCLLTEFRDQQIAWEDILPDAPRSRQSFLCASMYLWPLQYVKQHVGGTVFVRTPFAHEKATQSKELPK
jgi:hypothetical protein